MPNEILKTIKIDVNSSEYKALLASLTTISKLEYKINQLNEENVDLYKQSVKALKEELNNIKAAIAAKTKYKGIEGEALKLKGKEVEKELQILKINQQLNRMKKQAFVDEKKARALEAKEAITGNAAIRSRERQREKWAEGKPNFYELGQRYKGTTGLFNLLSDQAERKGEAEVAGYDEQIATSEDTIKANEAQIEALEATAKRTKSGEIKKSSKEYKEIEKLKAENESLASGIEDTKDKKAQSIGNTKTQMNKYAAMAAAAQKVAGQLQKIAGVLLAPFKALANATMDVVKQMLDFKTGVATYNTSSSLITNATAREQQMKYGLSSSQNYAFSQAKEMLNIQSDEDLMYMNSEQREKFLSYMDRYSQWYDKMESSGVLDQVQEMQLEFQELKQEIAMEFLQWVAENKETIMTCIRGIFNFVKAIADFVLTIIRILSFGRYSGNATADDSDEYDSNTTNNNQRSTVINVNANTTNNATGVLGSQEALDQFNKENFNKLAKQIATAVGG